LRILPVDHQDLADLLHGVRLEPRADRLHPRPAGIAVIGRRAHLDERVRLERAVDLGDDFLGEALVADDDHRSELVRPRSQLAAT
jgi:hypothetical protein